MVLVDYLLQLNGPVQRGQGTGQEVQEAAGRGRCHRIIYNCYHYQLSIKITHYPSTKNSTLIHYRGGQSQKKGYRLGKYLEWKNPPPPSSVKSNVCAVLIGFRERVGPHFGGIPNNSIFGRFTTRTMTESQLVHLRERERAEREAPASAMSGMMSDSGWKYQIILRYEWQI